MRPWLNKGFLFCDKKIKCTKTKKYVKFKKNRLENLKISIYICKRWDEMESGTSLMIGKVILYCLPLILLLFFSKSIRNHFKRQQSTIKLPDLMIPFLIIGIHILSMLTYEFSLIPYFLIFIFSLGIILLVWTAVKKGEILYKSFFKMYWRFVFISSIFTYYGLVLANIFLT